MDVDSPDLISTEASEVDEPESGPTETSEEPILNGSESLLNGDEVMDEVIDEQDKEETTDDQHLDQVIEDSEELIQDEDRTEVNEPNVEQTTSKSEKLTQLPLGRVKHIMKLDPDVNMASQDAVFMVTKALELFIESLAIEAFSYTANSKKKTISKEDVYKAIDAVDALAFLDGAMD